MPGFTALPNGVVFLKTVPISKIARFFDPLPILRTAVVNKPGKR